MRKIGLTIAAFIFLLLFFIPNIVEYYIEKEDNSLIGREVIIDDIDINYFTGAVSIESLYLMEQNEVDTFAGFKLLEANIGIWSSINKEYSIEELVITNPVVSVSQNDSTFNFSDLIPIPDTTTVDETSPAKEITKYQLGSFRMIGLTAKFIDQNNEELAIDSLDINIGTLAWDQQLIKGDLFASMLEGGETDIDFEVDLTSGSYESQINVNELRLNQFSHFLKSFVKIQHLDGSYNNMITVNGNYLQDTTDLKMKGDIRIDDFRLIDSNSIEQLGFDSLSLVIDSIDLRSNQYRFNQFAIDALKLNYSIYPNSDSFSELLILEDSLSAGDLESTDTISVVNDTTSIFYSIDEITITNASLYFNDFTLIDQFDYSIDAINITTDSLDSSSPQAELHISAILNYLGELNTEIYFDLDDPKNFAYEATIDSVSLKDFSPYSLQFVGNPITSGLMYFGGSAQTSKHFLKSDNTLILDRFRLGDKVKHDESLKLPVKTAVSLLKNPKGEIKIKLPVRGNLDDPSFKIGRTVLNTLKNLVVKTVASPVSVMGKMVTSADKDVNEVPYQYLQTKFSEEQAQLISKIGNRINSRKENNISIIQYINPSREKAEIALFETKKKYYESRVDTVIFTIERAVNILPIDSSFQSFINAQTSQDSVMSLTERCVAIIGKETIDEKFTSMVNSRNEIFRQLMNSGDSTIVRTSTSNSTRLKDLRTVFKVVD